jgi:hypothetical protein
MTTFLFCEDLLEIKNVINSCKSEFVIIPITCWMRGQWTQHANVLIYNRKENTLERFEPGGPLRNKEFQIMLDYRLQTICRQLKIAYAKNLTNYQCDDDIGFCMSWSMWYAALRLQNSNLTNQEFNTFLKNKMTKERDYMFYIAKYAKGLHLSFYFMEFDNLFPSFYRTDFFTIERKIDLLLKFFNSIKSFIIIYR